MTTSHIRNQIRRAHLLMDALPHTHPKAKGDCPEKTRRLMIIKKSLGRIVNQRLHVDDTVSAAHSALSRASSF